MGDSAHMVNCANSRRWTDLESLFVKCFPIKAFGFLPPWGFGLSVPPGGGIGLVRRWSALLPPLRPGLGLAGLGT